MQDKSAGSLLGDAIGLAGRTPALVALAAVALIQVGYSIAFSQLIASREPGNVSMIGLFAAAGGFVIFLAVAAVQFQLARRLGDEGEPKLPPNIGLWIGLTLIYGVASMIWSTASSLAVVRFSQDVVAYPLALGAMRVVFQVAMFAVLVRSVAAAHSGDRVKFGQVWSILWSQRIDWLVTYAALAAATWLAIWFGGMAMRPFAGGSYALSSLPGAFLGAIGQIALILYAIAVYRACGDGDHEAATFA